MGKKKQIKRKKKKIFKITLGKLLFTLMLAYFVFTFYAYATKVNVSYYEVEEGSLVREHNYTGLVLKQEFIVNSQANGYIYYYVADGRKAAKGSPVYTVDEGGRLMDYISAHSDELGGLNSSMISDIRTEILNYSRNFDPTDFRQIYNIKSTLDAHTTEYASMNIFSSLQGELASAGIDYKQFNAESTGIVCAYTDGYESITEADVNAELFNTENYNKQTIKAGDLVTEGEPAYKLITDEAWELIFPVNEEDLKDYNDGDTIKLGFSDKGFTVKSKIRFISGTDGTRYGVVNLDSYVIQFAADRFVNFEIVTNDVSGLKIPDKSITTKDFYVVPREYLVTDENGNRGFNKAIVSGNGTSAQFVMPDIYNIDEEYAYIDCDDESCPLRPGDYVMPDAGAGYTAKQTATEIGGLYQINSKRPLKGAYNVNKGYTVFKRVEILESSNGYSIVKKNSSYGLQVYDHIVLDASGVHDGQLLYR